MSLQDLELSPFLISELYRDALVPVKTGEAIEEVLYARPKPAAEPVSYVAMDTEALGLPPMTAEPVASTVEPPPFQKPQQAEQPKPAPASQSPITATPAAQPARSAEPPQPSPTSAPQRTIKYLGGNKKRIAFIVNCKTDVYLPDNHLDWLGKMLDACKLNLGDVAIANIANNKFTIADIKEELQSTAVILLGTEPFAIQLPLNFPHFNLQSYDNMTFLYTPSPDQLNQSTNEAKLLKSKLWVSLQKLFKL
jgi:hypothetical protein